MYLIIFSFFFFLDFLLGDLGWVTPCSRFQARVKVEEPTQRDRQKSSGMQSNANVRCCFVDLLQGQTISSAWSSHRRQFVVSIQNKVQMVTWDSRDYSVPGLSI